MTGRSGEELRRAMEAASGLTADEFAALALYSLDQAGFRVGQVDAVRRMLGLDDVVQVDGGVGLGSCSVRCPSKGE